MLLQKVWKKQPGKYFCISTKDKLGKWTDRFFKKSDFEDIPDFIEDNLDKDVYWCPHGFSKPRRLREYAEIPKMLWADLDTVNPSELEDLMPTIAWSSSPGRYAGIWYIDDYMTEDLNKRLTYHIGADKGGWDITQVLRVPGTKNYKYPEAPKVKTLWSDGDDFTTKKLEKLLPKPKVVKKSESGLDPTAIYKKYERKLNTFVRRELLNGKPKKGKRSEVIWKLAHSLIEAGMTREEAFELLRISPWNKFKGRRDGDIQLKRELDKALEQHLTVSVDNAELFEEEGDEEEKKPYVFFAQTMEDVEEENMDWIWYPYLARGEVTILEGDPGLGKSYLAMMVARDIADGKSMPSVRKLKPVQGKIAYFDIENSPGTVTKKRLASNNLINQRNYIQETYVFSVDDEETLDRVHAAIAQLKPTLVVFDTLNTYIGGADIHKSSETQQAFKNFVDIARRHNCAVMVLRHLTKGNKDKALYRGQGSIAFTGLARVVITVGTHPDEGEEDTRVMAVTKINVTKPPKALTFTIKSLPDTLKDTDRSRFEWGDFVDLTSEDLVSVAPRTAQSKAKAESAEEFLTELLSRGPMKATAVIRAAEARSLSKKVIYQAADSMGIDKETSGYGKSRTAIWKLPKQK